MKTALQNYLFCVDHSEKQNRLELEALDTIINNECIEGFLICSNCKKKYPILDGVAILISDFVVYSSERPTVFSRWLMDCKTQEMRKFLIEVGNNMKETSKKIFVDDKYEESSVYYNSYKWAQYENSLEDHFLKLLRWKLRPNDLYDKVVEMVPPNINGIALDIGTSMGYSSISLSKKYSLVIGIDKSFSFIKEARNRAKINNIGNIEFCVSDFLCTPFKNSSFDLILAINVIDLIDPKNLTITINKLLKLNSDVIITSPYDHKDISNLDENKMRNLLESSGFEVYEKTKKNISYTPWILKITDRIYLFYFVDMVRARKRSKHIK